MAKGRQPQKFCMELFEGYFIMTDEYQYILYKRGKTKDGEDKEEVVGYYSKLQTLIKDLANKQLRASNVKTLDDLYKAMEKIEKKLNKLFPEYEVSRI